MTAIAPSTAQQSATSLADEDLSGFQVVLMEDARRHETLVQRTVSQWQLKIESDANARGALSDLLPEMRQQLAALVHDTDLDFQFYTERKSRMDALNTLAAEGDRRGRKLSRKLAAAREVLTDLRNYAAGLNPQIREPYKRVASKCLEQLLDLHRTPSSDYWRELRRGLLNSNSHPAPKNPMSDNMVALYWLFRCGCKLPAGEAEVRTGLIRNAFWDRWVRRVPFVEDHATQRPIGCMAVRHAVQRFHVK